MEKQLEKIEQLLVRLEERIEKLEKDSHPCKELHEFDVWPELNARIERLENT
jgi:hypothetical protein